MSSEYIECENCSFVLLAESPSEAAPRRQEQCPGCGGTSFEFTQN